jgi:hypothetical protein
MCGRYNEVMIIAADKLGMPLEELLALAEA